jgi:hypothetical protein
MPLTAVEVVVSVAVVASVVVTEVV